MKYHDDEFDLLFGQYSNGRIAIRLVNKNDIMTDGYLVPAGEEVLATATVNLPDYFIQDDEVFIHNYSEQEGLLDILVEAKIVSEPIKYVSSGFVIIPLCKLLVDPANYKQI